MMIKDNIKNKNILKKIKKQCKIKEKLIKKQNLCILKELCPTIFIKEK